MTNNFTALYDASVLYPAPLRSFLMYLAMAGLFRAKWTDAIHDEWTRSVARDRPDIPPEKLAEVRRLMDAHVLDCLVDGYEELIPALTLPDPDDRHVLAAAIKAGADVIVTVNLKDFPAGELDKFGIEAQHPDEFVVHLLGLSTPLVVAAAKTQRSSLKNPPMDAEEFLATLERQGLPQTVAILREYAGLL